MTTWVCIDVAKDTHRACAVDGGGRVLLSRAVPNTQEGVDALSAELRALPGPVRIGLDVDGSIAAFLQAVLLADGLALATCRARPSTAPPTATPAASASPTPGMPASSPTSRAPATTCARSAPRTTRPPPCACWSACRRDLVQDRIRRIARLRQPLSRARPGLEAELDLTRKGPLALLARHVTPAEIARATDKAIVRHLRRTPSLRDPERLARTCAARQRTAVPGEATLARLVREMAA